MEINKKEIIIAINGIYKGEPKRLESVRIGSPLYSVLGQLIRFKLLLSLKIHLNNILLDVSCIFGSLTALPDIFLRLSSVFSN